MAEVERPVIPVIHDDSSMITQVRPEIEGVKKKQMKF